MRSAVVALLCAATCSADFPEGTRLVLTATAASGMVVAGYSGDCAGDPCAITVGAAGENVAVKFTRAPMPCDGLMPAAIPAPVPFAVSEPIIAATSDGAGNFVLTTEPDYTNGSRTYHFVKLDNGAAREVARLDAPVINDPATYSIPREAAGQPAGFALLRTANAGDLFFDLRAPDASLGKTISLSLPLTSGETHQDADYQVAPGGGVAVLRDLWTSSRTYTIHYGRFDANGQTVVSDVLIDSNGGYITAWGVDFAGNVLLISVKGQPFTMTAASARWFDPRGTPMTEWFSIGELYIRNSVVAIPGGLALREEGDITLLFPDGQAAVQRPAQWLAERGSGAWWLQTIRGGTAFAAMPLGDSTRFQGPCGLKVEVLAADGTSCGCVDVAASYGIGRDGSAMTSDAKGFKVYPGLFR